MSEPPALTVAFRELSPVRVAYIACLMEGGQEQASPHIRESFRRIQTWFRELGLDPDATITLGALNAVEGRPVSYDCCLALPDEVRSSPEGIGIQELPGGPYAVMSIEKDPAKIGEAIGRFWREYVPEHGLAVDGSRPTYEIYWERTMDYCVPVL